MEREAALEAENERLRLRIQQLEQKIGRLGAGDEDRDGSPPAAGASSPPLQHARESVHEGELLDGSFVLPPLDRCDSLSLGDIRRYSRQLLMPEVGVEGTHHHTHLQCRAE
jgi:hypothetical protein